MRVYSGRDASVLHEFRSETKWLPGIAGLEDIDNDGCPEIAIGDPHYHGRTGRLRVISLRPDRTRGCIGSNGRSPRTVTTAARPGQCWRTELHDASPGRVAGLLLAPTSSQIDLAVLGARGCRVLAGFIPIGFGRVDAAGRMAMRLCIPNATSLRGVAFYTQFGVFDTSANTLGFTTTIVDATMIQ